jgi:transcriptional regulator with XRE-family HTH domain
MQVSPDDCRICRMAEPKTLGQQVLVKLVARLGGAEAASRRLGVSDSLLTRFIEGSVAAPDALVLQAIDVVFGVPLSELNSEQEDFAFRLRGIENEANLIADDVPMGITRNRVLHIATTARLLRLRFDVATNLIEPRRGKIG